MSRSYLTRCLVVWVSLAQISGLAFLAQLGGCAHTESQSERTTRLIRQLKIGSVAERTSAGQELLEIGDQVTPSLPALIELLKEKDPIVRQQSILVISSTRESGKSAIPELIPLLKDQDATVRSRTAIALWMVGESPKNRISLLTPLLRDPSSEVRDKAALALDSTLPKILPVLIPMLKDPDKNVRLSSLNTLFNAGHLDVLSLVAVMPSIIPLTKDSDPEVRTTAARTIGWIIPHVAVNVEVGYQENDFTPIISFISFSRDLTVREKLKKAQTKAAVLSLITLLKDPNNEVRSGAAEALGNLQGSAKSAIPSLIPLLKDQKEGVRWQATSALGRIGGESAKSAIPNLIPLLNDENENVRSKAAEKLRLLGYQK